jgi:hypothetical protein
LIHMEALPFFHLSRWFFGILVCASLYAFISRIFNQTDWRRFTFLLTVTGAGAGWLQAILNPGARPVDMLFADGYIFFGMATFPHYSATTTAILLSVTAFISYLKSGSPRTLIAIIFIGVVAQFINPIAFVLADLAMAGILIGYLVNERHISRGPLAGLLAIGLSQLPQLFLNARMLGFDPFWSRFTAQNAIPSPPITDLLWGYGIFWLLLPSGVMAVVNKRIWPAMGLLVWLAGALLLAYSPFLIQMRFLHAFIVPLSLCGVIGLKEEVFTRLRAKGPDWLSKRLRLAAFTILLISTVTSIKVSLGDAYYLYTHKESIFYEPRGLTQAINWLGNHARKDDIVLATERTSQWVAIRTGLPVFLGHLFETLDYQNKQMDISLFYQNSLSPLWLKDNNIRWVIYGPHEQNLSPLFRPDAALQLAFTNGYVQIYLVNSPD